MKFIGNACAVIFPASVLDSSCPCPTSCWFRVTIEYRITVVNGDGQKNIHRQQQPCQQNISKQSCRILKSNKSKIYGWQKGAFVSRFKSYTSLDRAPCVPPLSHRPWQSIIFNGLAKIYLCGKETLKFIQQKFMGLCWPANIISSKYYTFFFFLFWTLFLNLLRFLETYICTVYISKYKVEKNKLPITFFPWQKFTRHCQHSPLLIFCAKQLFPPPHETVFWVTVTRFS